MTAKFTGKQPRIGDQFKINDVTYKVLEIHPRDFSKKDLICWIRPVTSRKRVSK